MAEQLSAMRIDKWLWAARFFKTRQLANEAVSGGKVQVNGQRCKPSKEVQVGSHIVVHKEPYIWEITVTNLSRQRRPASEAVLLYEESEISKSRRNEQVARRKQEQAMMPGAMPDQRPNKKQRRLIHRFKRSE